MRRTQFSFPAAVNIQVRLDNSVVIVTQFDVRRREIKKAGIPVIFNTVVKLYEDSLKDSLMQLGGRGHIIKNTVYQFYALIVGKVIIVVKSVFSCPPHC